MDLIHIDFYRKWLSVICSTTEIPNAVNGSDILGLPVALPVGIVGRSLPGTVHDELINE